MLFRKMLPCLILVGIGLITMPSSLHAQCSAVADPGFETLALGSFGAVVSPTFSAGFWGDENGTIVTAIWGNENGAGDTSAACPGVVPHSGNRMLQMGPSGNNTETWQAVPVVPYTVSFIAVSAWFNACDGITPRGIVHVRTFNSDSGWPTWTFIDWVPLVLDNTASTWEQISLECIEIPIDTKWILIDVNFRTEGLEGQTGYVDDVVLVCGCEPVLNEGKSWGALKALFH